MAIMVHWKESGSLRNRLREIRAAVAPDSPRMDRFRTSVKKVVVQDNEDKLFRLSTQYGGTDRFGKPLIPPARSTVRSWERRGLVRQLLAPHGLGSRTVTNFRVRWVFDGSAWRLIAGWVGIPWMLYHLRGCPRGSNPKRPNWALPKRDLAGISPQGWVTVRAEFARLARSLINK